MLIFNLRARDFRHSLLHQQRTFQVDKHIRKLDSDLARFEAEIQDKAISATRSIDEGSQKRNVFCTIFYCVDIYLYYLLCVNCRRT